MMDYVMVTKERTDVKENAKEAARIAKKVGLWAASGACRGAEITTWAITLKPRVIVFASDCACTALHRAADKLERKADEL